MTIAPSHICQSVTHAVCSAAPPYHDRCLLLFLSLMKVWMPPLVFGAENSKGDRQEFKELAVWCGLNDLELNTLKKVEMIVDFRRNPPTLPPLTITNSTVTAVESFRFLRTTISQNLKWVNHNLVSQKYVPLCTFCVTQFYIPYCTFRRSFKEKCPLSGAKTQVIYVNPGTFLICRYRYILLCFYYIATEKYCGGSECKYPGSVLKS